MGIGFKKPINLKTCPQQEHFKFFFLYIGISGKKSRMTSYIKEMSSPICSIEREPLELRNP